MRTLVMFVICAAALAGEDHSAAPPQEEWPLYEVARCTGDNVQRASWVWVMFIRGEELGAERVEIAGFTVRLRADGKSHTSVMFVGKLSPVSLEPAYHSAVILVPVAEDVAVWQTEIARWKRAREEYLKELKPRRVLPCDRKR